jgi:hypothetical protein
MGTIHPASGYDTRCSGRTKFSGWVKYINAARYKKSGQQTSNRSMRLLKRLTGGMIVFFIIFIASLWVTSRALEPQSVGEAKAPNPRNHPDAVIQIYGANVWGFRGNFAIHTWVAAKAHGAAAYQIYQVIGWRLRRGRSVVSITEGNPAQPWYGSPPILLYEIRGDEAQALIGPVRDAVQSYSFDREYKMWPGPNSNSFTAWIGLEVPQLELDLPLKAIGQSWMKREHPGIAAAAP